MHKLHVALLQVSAFVLLIGGSGIADANMVDTLTGQTPGDLIGCEYTFQNGDPSIPCANDVVAPDGTVSFIKPNAPFDNVEYFDFTTHQPVANLLNPLNVPINGTVVVNDRFPISSFFDIFVELQPFDSGNWDLPGALHVGESLDFSGGLNTDGIGGITVPNSFTGTIQITGFDIVSVPEPATWALLVLGMTGLFVLRRKS